MKKYPISTVFYQFYTAIPSHASKTKHNVYSQSKNLRKYICWLFCRYIFCNGSSIVRFNQNWGWGMKNVKSNSVYSLIQEIAQSRNKTNKIYITHWTQHLNWTSVGRSKYVWTSSGRPADFQSDFVCTYFERPADVQFRCCSQWVGTRYLEFGYPKPWISWNSKWNDLGFICIY